MRDLGYSAWQQGQGFGAQSERMQLGFALKVVEFDHFEIGVIHDFPSAEKLQG